MKKCGGGVLRQKFESVNIRTTLPDKSIICFSLIILIKVHKLLKLLKYFIPYNLDSLKL